MDYENENPFAVTRLSDPCMPREFSKKIEKDLSTVDRLLENVEEKITSKATKQELTKIRQSQRLLHATLKTLQHGLDKHSTFEKEFAHVTIDRTKLMMLSVGGKRLPLKTVAHRSGREKTQHLKDLEKKKQEAANKGRSKKRARLNASLRGRTKIGK